MKQLDEIKARCEKATKGPWVTRKMHDEIDGYFIKYSENRSMFQCAIVDGFENNEVNAELIAHARTDIPKLVKVAEVAIEALDEEIKWASDSRSVGLATRAKDRITAILEESTNA